MKNWLNIFGIFFFLTKTFIPEAQTLPSNRAVDWTLAGLRLDTVITLPSIDMASMGVVGDGQVANDLIVSTVIANLGTSGAILNFPSGQFLFNNTINLPSNIVIKGKGRDSTIFLMDLGGSGHAFLAQGVNTNDSSALILSANKDMNQLDIWSSSDFSAGDWIQIKQYDSDLITSSWAEKSVGQMVQIDSVWGNTLWLKSPLRMDYDIARMPYVQKIIPQKNIGIECLKIKRLDDTAPQQSSNIHFSRAVNCWVKGIESENCTFSHITGEFSSNLYIAQCYFHHGFDYGGNGRAYGVVLHFTTGECLIEDNIFEHLRHSMLLQAGANGNVFAYNYSFDPFWSSTPNNAAGELVLHGNYVYSNLFEQNICQNIVIDDSHGANGSYNTFLRNRAEGYGIFFSATSSPNQNFLGNDITNTSFPYSLVNYSIKGTGHFIHGNNNKGTITPTGTQVLPDLSYAYANQPAFVPNHQWAKIGTPNTPSTSSIPAKDRYLNNQIFDNTCSNLITTINKTESSLQNKFYPNPVQDVLTIESNIDIYKITVYNELGLLVFEQNIYNQRTEIDVKNWTQGVYFLKLHHKEKQAVQKVIKI